jgi:hypothetical protein
VLKLYFATLGRDRFLAACEKARTKDGQAALSRKDAEAFDASDFLCAMLGEGPGELSQSPVAGT